MLTILCSQKRQYILSFWLSKMCCLVFLFIYLLLYIVIKLREKSPYQCIQRQDMRVSCQTETFIMWETITSVVYFWQLPCLLIVCVSFLTTKLMNTMLVLENKQFLDVLEFMAKKSFAVVLLHTNSMWHTTYLKFLFASNFSHLSEMIGFMLL